MSELAHLVTETRNQATMQIDRMGTLEMLQVINQEDHRVADAVQAELPNIARAVEAIVPKLAVGGRLVYCGAGTSGRIGLMDAVECPPTYGVSPETVQGLMAGGMAAFQRAKEGAEDSLTLCVEDMKNINFGPGDVLCAIAASGRTPYCLGGMRYAHELGAVVIAITCNPASAMAKEADIAISPVSGPEVVTGSTRMKAGSCQKLVCNMLSTATMIRLGKVYGNLMVDMMPTNEKLVERAKTIVMEATGVNRERATQVLTETGYRVKLAVFMLVSGLSLAEATQKLDENGGIIARALEE